MSSARSHIPAWCLAIALLAAFWPCAAAGWMPWAGARIVRIDMDNATRVRNREILNLLGLKEGRTLDPRRLERGIALVARKTEVGRLVVHGRETPDGVVVRVEVRPRLLARAVEVTGVPRRLRKRLEALLQTRVDRPVREPLLRKDRESLREAMREEGYPRARVWAEVLPDPSGQWARVTFRVEAGEPERITSVEVPGGIPLEPWRLRALLGLGPGDPASRTRLREGVERVLGLLWDEGYPEARLEGQAAFEPGRGGVVLRLPLVAGRPVRIRLTGFEGWLLRDLRRALRARFGRVVDRDWCEDAARLLEARLRDRGYREARVGWVVRSGEPARTVEFRIAAGPRFRVRRVRFVGNRSLRARRLRRYMALVQGGVVGPPVYTDRALARDLRVLQDYYATKGFWDARVELGAFTVSAEGDVDLTLRVHEGVRYAWSRLDLEVRGVDAGPVERVIRGHMGRWADRGALERARQAVLQMLGSQGYPDARAAFEVTKDPQRGAVDTVFRVEAGRRVRFGRVVVAGNVRTQTKVVRRELAFRRGDPWDPAAVRESRQRLYRLGFFQRVRIGPAAAPDREGFQDVLVEVEEQDAGVLEFGLGYGTEEGVKGSVRVAHANLQGYGRFLGLRMDYDRFDRSVAVNFREPWLFNHPLDLRLSLVRRTETRDAYHLSALGFQASLERAFGPRAKGSVLYTLESNELSDVSEEAAEAGADTGSYLLSSVGPVVVWDSRDDPFNPRRGFYHSFQAEWASDLLGSEVRFERYVASVSGFFSYGRATLALQGRGGIAFTLTQAADLPVNKRFFLGGRSSVRGFRRDEIGPKDAAGDPVGGDVMVNLRAELRWRWKKRFGIAVFWDGGNVWNRSLGSPDYTDLRQGAGLGVRFETPVGPLALDLGFKLDRRGGEDPYVWHFTVGNVF